MTRILIVDDDPDIRLVLRSILESYGYHCEEARHGLEALGKIRSESFHIILLDYSMPGMNGLQVLKKMARLSLRTKPSVIMITAHSEDSLHQEAVEAGAVAVLPKPFDLDEVLLVIARTMKNRCPSSPCCQHSP